VSHTEQWVAVAIIVASIGFVSDAIEKRLKDILGELRLLNYKIDKRD
jgi:hypothetical protein